MQLFRSILFLGALALLSTTTQALLQKRSRASEDEYTHTLVQFLGSSSCTSERLACLSLKLDSYKVVTVPERHVADKTVCNKLLGGPQVFTVDSCARPEGACPADSCDCKKPVSEYPLNECVGHTLYGGGATSYKLVVGKMEGCATEEADVNMGRWCEKFDPKLTDTENLGGGGEEEGPPAKE